MVGVEFFQSALASTDCRACLIPGPENAENFSLLTTIMSSTQTQVDQATIHSTSHTALEIYDIIHQILMIILKDKNGLKTDLLSMALCCKAFKDPSLDILWTHMTSVVPLLKLIPGVEEIEDSLVHASPPNMICD
jgi:hypothetical protein